MADAESGRPIVRADIESFLYREVRLLDERRFAEWMNLFAKDGYYWVPAYPGQKDPYETVSIFFDDRELMKTRLSRLHHPQIHAQKPPSRTCHFVSNVEIDEAYGEPGEILAYSTLMMLEYRLDKQTTYGGRCRHLLRPKDDDFLIAWKRVDLINCDGVFEPLAVPF
ncbi:MAG: Biphenyl 2,3-dioxygenase subunit beta [Alphaproteobacteria bacterium MarineAlpha11_Bin1]|nr:MAG: Biphenyl 2,3-dioxygenase subunit beta [Alphaproteobacteria bacterium MarineAlpha11_Bin1]